MDFIKWLNSIPNFFDWYTKLVPSKRVQFNYIILLVIVMTLSYYNDKRHTENYAILVDRIDRVNNARAKEQEKYSKSLEFYTQKFNDLLQILVQSKMEKETIKNKRE